MQAGDRLDRIQGGEQAASSEFALVRREFEHMCDNALFSNVAAVRSFADAEVLPHNEMVELLLRDDHEDGSYLYIMIEATPRFDRDGSSIPHISVIEYGSDDVPLRKHTYWTDATDIVRRKDDYAIPESETHPSLVDLLNIVQNMRKNATHQENLILDTILEKFKDTDNGRSADQPFEIEQNNGDNPVSRDEIEKLGQLIDMSYPWLPRAAQ